jgi:hypothetical protein
MGVKAGAGSPAAMFMTKFPAQAHLRREDGNGQQIILPVPVPILLSQFTYNFLVTSS